MDEFFASADTSAAGRGDGKVSKLELRNAVRNAPRCPHQSLCARIITLYIARTHAQVAKLTTSAGARRVSEQELIRLMRFIDVGETDDEVSRDEMHQAMKRALEHGDGGVDAELIDGSAATGEQGWR